jgi:SRSO17 transposase
MFDSFFTSKAILKWLNKNGFKFTTRIKKNRTIYIDGTKSLIQDLKLEVDQSVICTIKGIQEQVKILMFYHKNEEVYVCSNNISLTNAELKAEYKSRWNVEVFHRESKEKLGLENFQVEEWQKLVNHVGFVCLAYSILTILRQNLGGSVGDVKFKLQDEVYGISSSVDTFELKLAS